MNMYQELNREYRAFKESEELEKRKAKSLKESEETTEEVVEDTPVTESTEEVTPADEVLTESEDVASKEAIDDQIAELKVRLDDGDLSEDDKAGIKKEIAALEEKKLKLEEGTAVNIDSDDIKDKLPSENTEVGYTCKECGGPTKEGQEVCEECSIKKESEPTIEIDDNEDEVSTEEVVEEPSVADDIKALIDKATEQELPEFAEALTVILNKVQPPVEDEVTEEPVEDEDLIECEVKGSRIIRLSPSAKAFMIEAETTDGIKYFVGKNYDEENRVLDEAEQFDDKTSAANHFKTLLK